MAAPARFVFAAAALLLAAFLLQTLSTLRTTSVTFDEPGHLAAGYAQLSTGRATVNPEHPPLAKLIAASALWPQGGRLDSVVPNWRTLDEFSFGQQFLFGPGRDADALIDRARLGMILLGLVLCAVAFLWSRALFGDAGALLTLTLCVCSPTILAHARLVTTDVPVAAFGVLAAWLTWRLTARVLQPRRGVPIGLSIATGLALGAALASKYTGILFVPALVVAVSVSLWRVRRVSPWALSTALKSGAIVALSAALLVMATYGWPPTLAAYVGNVSTVGANNTKDFEYYLFGEYRRGGFPLYFPIALLLKSSFAELLAALGLVALPIVRRMAPAIVPRQQAAGVPSGTAAPSGALFLLLPAVCYGAVIAWSAPQLGVRYLIPTLPFFFVGAGALGAALWSARWTRIVYGLVVGLQLFAAATSRPDPISYFNGIFGCRGPAAIACMDDSNLDWGQDLRRVAATVDSMRRPDEQVVLMYFGTANPSAYLRNWRDIDEANEILHPRPQLYALSLHLFNYALEQYGRPSGVDWLRRFQPAAFVGNTYVVFDFRGR